MSHQSFIQHRVKLGVPGARDRVRFETADASSLRGPFDPISFFDAWHDTADPIGVARRGASHGFGSRCRIAQTPKNLVYAVRP